MSVRSHAAPSLILHPLIPISGAQAILYMTGGTLTYIGEDIGTQYPNWLLTANTLVVTAICPFVGYITDLLGRRWVAVVGSLCLIVASVVQATSQSLASSVVAQAIGGAGAGICELTALAGYEFPPSSTHKTSQLTISTV